MKDLSDLSRELREDDAPSNDDNPSSLRTSSMEESNKEKSDVESNVIKDREDVTDELKKMMLLQIMTTYLREQWKNQTKRSLMLNRTL